MLLLQSFPFISTIEYWNCTLERQPFIDLFNKYLVSTVHQVLCLGTEDTRQTSPCSQRAYSFGVYAMNITFISLLW